MPVPESCMKCSDHEVMPDPDPSDWFCDDDCCVLCKLAKQEPNTTSRHVSERYNFRASTVGCRPYNLKKETAPPPKWCPKRKK